MWFEILKKDLMKQKSVNIILFLFITLSTIFLASSASNIRLVMNGINTYMEYANVSDIMAVLASGIDDEETFEAWLQESDEITEYAREEMCAIKGDDIMILREVNNKENKDSFLTKGVALYLGHTGGRYAKPLDSEGNDLTLAAGEVALPPCLMEENKLHTGDLLEIKIDDKTYTYKVAAASMDIMYGREMNGMCRLVFDKKDYEKMTADTDKVKIGIYGINTSDREKTLDGINGQELANIMSVVEKEIYPLLYVFEMIVAALLIVVGICLILISLMILRFSLVFTMEEGYREIGVMKAVGIRDFSIRKLYFIKYFAIVTVGAAIGFFISIPLGNSMMKSVSKNMVMGDGAGFPALNLLCSIAVILFVTGMCILFTGRLKKVSAIDAIRNGGNGERYEKRRGLSLYKCRYMGTVSFLGLNDILCNKRRYVTLLLTFCISFILITVPLNTLTTIESDEMARKFNMDPDAAIYIERLEAEGDEPYHNTEELANACRRIEQELAEKGYHAKLSVGALISIEYQMDGAKRGVKPLTYYPVGSDGSYMEYSKGVPPRLENEIAFSKKIMEKNKLQIGDTVTAKLNGKEKTFVITGYYSDYMQLGESARLNPAIDMSGIIVGDYWKTMVNMDMQSMGIDMTQDELVQKMEKEFPQYKWITAQDAIDANVGSVKSTLRAIQLPMTLMLCVLIMLISLLMMKLFIVREKGQLAMLKSIGYHNRYIRSWLVMRMVWVVLFSMIFAVPLSMLSNRFVLRSIFAIMGAELQIQVDPLKAYVVYPSMLLIGIIMATVFATGSVKKIQAADMKIIE